MLSILKVWTSTQPHKFFPIGGHLFSLRNHLVTSLSDDMDIKGGK